MTEQNNAFGEFGARSPKFDELLKKYQTIDENGVVAAKPTAEPKPEEVKEEAPVLDEETAEETTAFVEEGAEEEAEAEEEEAVITEPETEPESEEEIAVEPAVQAEETEEEADEEEQQEDGFSIDLANAEPQEEPEPDFSYDLDMFGTGSAKSEKVIDIDSFDDSWLDSAFDESLFYNAGALVEEAEEELVPEPEVEAEPEYAEESQPEPEDIEDGFIDDIQPDAQKSVMAGGYIAPSDFSDFSFDPESGMAFDDDDEAFAAVEKSVPASAGKKPAKKKKKPAAEKKESGKNEMTCVTGFSKDYKASEGKGSKKEGFFSRNLIPKKEDSKGEKIRKIIMILCVIAFLGSAIYLFNDYVIEPYKNSKQLSELESLISDSDKPADKLTLEQQYPGVEFPEGMLEKYAALYAKNQDFVGWINIDGLDISLPIVQGKNNEEYLKKSFEGKKNKYGSIFMNCANKVDRLDYNTTLFGHYMYDSKMFGNLMQYKSAEGYKKAPVIEFNTLFADYKWKVFAVFITNGTQEGDDGYLFNYIFTDLSSEEAVESFMGEIKQRSIYYPPVDIAVSDKILTLSTCTYEFEEARLVILARMLRPGESETVDTSKIRFNSNPRYPAAYYTEKELSNPYASAYRWYPS